MIAIEPLFDPSYRVPFRKPQIDQIPEYGSILYTIWNTKGEFIYVGIGGIRGSTVKDRKPRSRILQHYQGVRGGDQFCIYIQDYFVLPELIGKPYTPQNRYLDKLVRDYIHTHMSYAYVIDQTEESHKRVPDFERQIQQGAWKGMKPMLNPL